MRLITELFVSSNDIKKCIIDASQEVENIYTEAFESVSNVIQQSTRNKSKVDEDTSTTKQHSLSELLKKYRPNNPNPTRLEEYYFSKIRANNYSLEALDRVKVNVYGHVISKSWKTSSPDTDTKDTSVHSSHTEYSSYEEYCEKMDKVIDSITTRNNGELVSYNPHLPSTTVYHIEQCAPGEWSNKNILPIGLIIEGAALYYLIENKMRDLLCDIESKIVITRW